MNWNVSLTIFTCLISLALKGQSTFVDQPEAISEKTKAKVEWVNNLYEHGVKVDGDTMIISNEVKHLIANAELREFMYPEEYSWEATVFLLENMELKKAFWYLINLYPENKEKVTKIFLKYDMLFEMDKVLIATFYTYSMVDPIVCDIVDGELVIDRPDLAEEKLSSLKEALDYIIYYRGHRQVDAN